jgi:hypothetical protein
MELKDFISNTIIQIIEGVTVAQKYGEKHGAMVNPNKSINFGKGDNFALASGYDDFDYMQIVNFDIAITSSEGGEAKVKAGIYVLGAQGKNDFSSSSQNRISFSIPISLPKK